MVGVDLQNLSLINFRTGLNKTSQMTFGKNANIHMSKYGSIFGLPQQKNDVKSGSNISSANRTDNTKPSIDSNMSLIAGDIINPQDTGTDLNDVDFSRLDEYTPAELEGFKAELTEILSGDIPKDIEISARQNLQKVNGAIGSIKETSGDGTEINGDNNNVSTSNPTIDRGAGDTQYNKSSIAVIASNINPSSGTPPEIPDNATTLASNMTPFSGVRSNNTEQNLTDTFSRVFNSGGNPTPTDIPRNNVSYMAAFLGKTA